jgi:crossover junction endodeoxyribonuclease RuvC
VRILGIDPGSLRCGYALLEDLGGRVPLVREVGVWVLGAGKPLPERLVALQRGLDALLERQAPEVLSLEAMFLHKNVNSALVLGHARGVVMARCAHRGMSVYEYSPSSVKQSVAGSGRASKESVADMVRRQLALQELPDSADATDALAIALDPPRFFAQIRWPRASAPRRKDKGFDVDAYLARIGRPGAIPRV